MIIKEEMYIRSLKRKRHIDIYVPDDYQSAKKRYPVLIINDGQNAFFDEQSYIGKSWGFLESVRELKLDVILVAIYCNFEPVSYTHLMLFFYSGLFIYYVVTLLICLLLNYHAGKIQLLKGE